MNLKFLVVCALSVYGCLGIDEQVACDEQCAPSYPLHTYPKTSDSIACTRGCRIAYLDRYTSEPTGGGCNKTCKEAYGYDSGAAFACSVGCGIQVESDIVDSDLAEVSMINSLMDVLFVTRVMDMLSYDPEDEVGNRWGNEVDVYLSEDWNSANSSTDGNTADVTWSVYSMAWFYDYIPSSQVSTSTNVDKAESPDPSSGYYLVYYKHWSLTQFGLASQLICYITLFLFMVALLKCCHMLLSDGSDDTDRSLSVSADKGYYESSDEDDEELAALLRKKRQLYVSDIIQKPVHTEHALYSMSSFLPVQNTRLNGGSKVEGILTIV